MILANTEELHEKNDRLRCRVRELEDALRAMQASAAPEQQHPLLQDELLQLKVPVTGHGDDQQPQTGSVATKVDDDDIADTFGMLFDHSFCFSEDNLPCITRDVVHWHARRGILSRQDRPIRGELHSSSTG